MIDKPLYGNPLAGGQQARGGMFRQEGDMGRYVAFNDPGQPGAGYSNLQDYLAAGNQMPQLPNREPLKSVSNANMFTSNATSPNLPMSLLELDPIKGGAKNPMDEYQRGYMDSDFYSPRSTTDVQKFNYKGKDMQGSGTYVSGFENYLNSIGQGDLFKRPPNELMSQELTTIGGPTPPPGYGTPMDPIGVGQDIFGNNPAEIAVPSTPNPIQGVGLDGAPINPYNRVGQQLTGPNQFNDQFSSMGDRLTKLEEGITSLLNQNRGFGFNSMQPRYGAPNYGYSPFSMTGLGSLFGGYYG